MGLCSTIVAIYVTVLLAQYIDGVKHKYKSSCELKAKVWETCCVAIFNDRYAHGRGKRSSAYFKDSTKSIEDRNLSGKSTAPKNSRSGDSNNARRRNKQIPSMNDMNAKSFIIHRRSTACTDNYDPVNNLGTRLGVTVSGLTEECCSEGCTYEEVKEGSKRYWWRRHLLKEECMDESKGCRDEEVDEHCN